MIFKWLRDARSAPGSSQSEVDAPRSPQSEVDAPVFLPVEIMTPARAECVRPVLPNSVLPDCLLGIEIAGGHRLRVSGAYDPEALAQLSRGLSG